MQDTQTGCVSEFCPPTYNQLLRWLALLTCPAGSNRELQRKPVRAKFSKALRLFDGSCIYLRNKKSTEQKYFLKTKFVRLVCLLLSSLRLNSKTGELRLRFPNRTHVFWTYARKMLLPIQNLNLFLEKIGFILHMQNNFRPLEGFLRNAVVERDTFFAYNQSMPEIYKFCLFLW